jgi:hypothetical protein
LGAQPAGGFSGHGFAIGDLGRSFVKRSQFEGKPLFFSGLRRGLGGLIAGRDGLELLEVKLLHGEDAPRSSVRMNRDWASRPDLRALMEVAFPYGVRGPVHFWELRRLASTCFWRVDIGFACDYSSSS